MTYRYLSNVTTLNIDSDRCAGCGRCVEVCPHHVLEMKNSKVYAADRDRCIECGACGRNCPFGAIKVSAGVGCAAAILGSKGGNVECGCGEGKGCC
ncbi:MAG TPA: mercury methylation ferredoxin HgcB [Spirochaetota bacterium]|nr:mercury methylation ferredoxin HgcB [Spirochaetota bacterium]